MQTFYYCLADIFVLLFAANVQLNVFYNIVYRQLFRNDALWFD